MIFYDSRTVSQIDRPSLRRDAWVALTCLPTLLDKSRQFERVKICWCGVQQRKNLKEK